MAAETFSLQGNLHPDWNAAADWSGSAVPGAGTIAIVNAVNILVDPQTVLLANITLEGGAALIGNGAGFALGPAAALQAQDSNALYANGAIVNEGTITVSGTAASLAVVVQAGSEIASLYGLSIPSFENTGNITLSNGGLLDITGTEFSNTGTVTIEAAAFTVNGGWVDGGQGAIAPGGVIEISHGGEASFNEGVVDQDFEFNGSGTINFGDVADVSDVAIGNFTYRDEIITGSVAQAESLLANGIVFTTALPAGETLSVQSFSGGAIIGLEPFYASPPNTAFQQEDAQACFASGTRLLTGNGYVPVEELQPGMELVTAAGVLRKLRWLGWRRIDIARHSRRRSVQPISLAAGALADGVPARPLTLSPDHALLLHGVLVPVKLLVNGVSIRRNETCRSITYYHVELDRHDIVLAENAMAETYIDTGNRNTFSNAAGRPWATPVFGRGKQWNHMAYADLCLDGPRLKQIRRQLFERVRLGGFQPRDAKSLYLDVDGEIIMPSRLGASMAGFRLMAGHKNLVRIRSITFVPMEFYDENAKSDDERKLGVAISRIKLNLQWSNPAKVARCGFFERAEGDLADWTNGQAVIAVPPETRFIGLRLQAWPKIWEKIA